MKNFENNGNTLTQTNTQTDNDSMTELEYIANRLATLRREAEQNIKRYEELAGYWKNRLEDVMTGNIPEDELYEEPCYEEEFYPDDEAEEEKMDIVDVLTGLELTDEMKATLADAEKSALIHTELDALAETKMLFLPENDKVIVQTNSPAMCNRLAQWAMDFPDDVELYAIAGENGNQLIYGVNAKWFLLTKPQVKQE